MNGFILAATESGSGKTLISCGLMKALSRSYSVKPFKAGPDYIDPMFHTFSVKRPSYNLDLILCGAKRARSLFYSKLNEEDIAVIEGVMGLYDGVEIEHRYSGSTADLAEALEVPVILIVDGRGKSRSIAALINGFLNFRSSQNRLRFAGLIINRVKNEHLYLLLKKQIEENCNIEVLGWIPEDPSFSLNSRHLGLIMPEEIDGLDRIIDRLADHISEHVDLLKMIENTEIEYKEQDGFLERLCKVKKGAYKGLRIAVAYDQAFNFYYQDNLDLLDWLGVELLYFSPLNDQSLPENIDALYIGGGYPEVFAKTLKENEGIKQMILQKLDRGLPCYAECGGQIFLGETILVQFNNIKMTGFLPVSYKLTDRLVRFGYARLYAELFNRKYHFNIHEFHRSVANFNANISKRFCLSKNGRDWNDGGVYKNTLFGYPHIHFFAEPDGPRLLIDTLDYLLERKNHDHC